MVRLSHVSVISPGFPAKADIQARDIPVTPDTLFFTGSITKEFASAALSFLVEDNQNFPNIKWDTPVSNILWEDLELEDDWDANHVTLEEQLTFPDTICLSTTTPKR